MNFSLESEIARSALEDIADNIAYIRNELPSLTLPDDIRTLVLSVCLEFDPIVKRIAPGESAGALAPIADALAEMRDSVDLYVFGQDADGLKDAIYAMHDVVMRLQEDARNDSGRGLVWMLVSESAVNILNAYSCLRDLKQAELQAGTTSTSDRVGDFGTPP